MDFFSLLREHARTRTETMAVSSPRRSMTYRKLWSRIERASARLQQEWGVGQADIVAYCGDSHPDALVLFFALARCGARLLPLAADLQADELTLCAQQSSLRLLIKDDELSLIELPLTAALPSLCIQPLSALIATPCPHEPTELYEDPARPALMWRPGRQQTAIDIYSLAQLWETDRSEQLSFDAKKTLLFEPAHFSRHVLPTLQKGECLMLS